jgi:hypothetical protein
MNQKKLIKPALYSIAWSVFVYGCISFFNMDFNAANWSLDSRFLMVLFGFVMGAFVAIMSLIFNSDN